MATAVIMPRQGQSVESCIITDWHKQPGDSVKEGDILFSYETDKAAFEESAKASGKLLAVFFGADEDVPVLTTVAVIGEEGEDISAFKPEAGEQPSPQAPEKPGSEKENFEQPAITVAEESAQQSGTISPRARAAAARLNVDVNAAAPTGPDGRVIERDILRAAQSGGAILAPAANESVLAGDKGAYEEVKMSTVRRAIARSMQASLMGSAQLTNHSTFDAGNILAFRKQLKAMQEEGKIPNITLNDMVLFACSRVLLNHPDLNAHFVDDKIRRYRHVHLGMAVDTPRGLLVPTLFNADTLGLHEIAVKSKELAAAAQTGSIDPDLLTGATFTISNLGTLGVELFTPVINPPQTGILGVCSMVERVRVKDGKIETYPAMGLSLTYDHRVVDGAPAARFTQELASALENIAGLLI